jgi:hypothetical protein
MSKKLSDYVQSEDNLLIGDMFKTLVAIPTYKDVERTGEGLLLTYSNVKVSDSEKFVKWYDKSYSEIGKLSNAGVRVLSYILCVLPKNVDWVEIDMDDCMAHCGYTSVQAVRNGLLDLLEQRYIQRKSGGSNRFFINPNFFFNGQRHEILSLKGYVKSLKADLRENLKKDVKIKKHGS